MKTWKFHHLISTYLTSQDRNPNSEDEQKNTDDDFGQEPVLWRVLSLFKFNRKYRTATQAPKPLSYASN